MLQSAFGSAQRQGAWGSEQPGLMEDVPAPGREAELHDL